MPSRNNLALVGGEPNFAEAMARAAQGSFWDASASTLDQLANHANSTSPSSATLSNTAAGYTKLGGRYQFAAVAGAATDYALFAYQVPSTRTLFITSVRIDAMVTGAANATTATILDWALGVNSTAVSLATTDSGSTYGPRRIPLGMMAVEATTAIGVPFKNPIEVAFPSPLAIKPSRYLHVILQIPVGTATASEVIRGDVMFNGYFG
jgi:hypothetical protein